MDTLNDYVTKKFKGDDGYRQDLIEDDEEDGYLKNASNNRRCTDVPFLILQGVLLLVLFCLLGYCISNGNINRIIKGYDNCGNICGEKNTFIITSSRRACSSVDMTDRPYLKIDAYQRMCVARCDGDTMPLGKLCLPETLYGKVEVASFGNYITGFFKDAYICSYEILSVFVIALVFAFLVLLVLRHMVSIFIWGVLIGTILLFVFLCIYFGVAASQLPKGPEYRRRIDGDTHASITFGTAAIIVAVISCWIGKGIPFVTQLFREAGKSLMAIPILVYEPILTITTITIICASWMYFALWIESAGTPTETSYGKITFEKDSAMYFTYWFSAFMAIWMIQFACCSQDMLVAGAISTWYFANNKSRLSRSILISIGNMLKYHLGTLSLSSLFISALQFLRLVFLFFQRPLRAFACGQYYMHVFERWMRYFSKNACIITSIHGYNFRQAGSRAFNLIINNIVRILAINAIGGYVLILAKILVAGGAAAIGYLMIRDKPDLGYLWPMLALMAVIAYIIAHCFFNLYETAIDTIFICFCEDCEINDGINRPYFMSRDLMEFIERTKICLGEREQNNQTTVAVLVV